MSRQSLSIRPSNNCLIHFYKRCVSMLTHGSASFFRANDCPLKHVHLVWTVGWVKVKEIISQTSEWFLHLVCGLNRLFWLKKKKLLWICPFLYHPYLQTGITGLSKRPSNNSLIHFYKRCVSPLSKPQILSSGQMTAYWEDEPSVWTRRTGPVWTDLT